MACQGSKFSTERWFKATQLHATRMRTAGSCSQPPISTSSEFLTSGRGQLVQVDEMRLELPELVKELCEAMLQLEIRLQFSRHVR